MKMSILVRWLSRGAVLLLVSQCALAQQTAGIESCRDVLTGSGAGPKQSEYCQQRAATARSDLRGRGIDPAGLSDIDAIDRADREYDAKRAADGLLGSDTQTADEKRADLRDWGVSVQDMSDAQVRERWNGEKVNRSIAEMQAARRTQESDRLRELGRQDSVAAQNRQIDEVARRASQGGEGLGQGAEVARIQGNAALQTLGINPDALTSEDEDEADAEADAFELRMYQQMIDSGLAPQCKGMTGSAMITCVDRVMDGDE